MILPRWSSWIPPPAASKYWKSRHSRLFRTNGQRDRIRGFGVPSFYGPSVHRFVLRKIENEALRCVSKFNKHKKKKKTLEMTYPSVKENMAFGGQIEFRPMLTYCLWKRGEFLFLWWWSLSKGFQRPGFLQVLWHPFLLIFNHILQKPKPMLHFGKFTG